MSAACRALIFALLPQDFRYLSNSELTNVWCCCFLYSHLLLLFVKSWHYSFDYKHTPELYLSCGFLSVNCAMCWKRYTSADLIDLWCRGLSSHHLSAPSFPGRFYCLNPTLRSFSWSCWKLLTEVLSFPDVCESPRPGVFLARAWMFANPWVIRCCSRQLSVEDAVCLSLQLPLTALICRPVEKVFCFIDLKSAIFSHRLCDPCLKNSSAF